MKELHFNCQKGIYRENLFLFFLFFLPLCKSKVFIFRNNIMLFYFSIMSGAQPFNFLYFLFFRKTSVNLFPFPLRLTIFFWLHCTIARLSSSFMSNFKIFFKGIFMTFECIGTGGTVNFICVYSSVHLLGCIFSLESLLENATFRVHFRIHLSSSTPPKTIVLKLLI